MSNATPTLRELIVYSRDGEWGEEDASDASIPMRVIRGTDFDKARLGELGKLPIRQIGKVAADRKKLEAFDIVIETAGGTKDRPTGRTLLITPEMLAKTDLPITCASFARFLRLDRSKVDPVYVFWFLQDLYFSGIMEQHQVQHTGVARFQFTKFAETQKIPLPRPSDQRAIGAEVRAVGALMSMTAEEFSRSSA